MLRTIIIPGLFTLLFLVGSEFYSFTVGLGDDHEISIWDGLAAVSDGNTADNLLKNVHNHE